MKGTPSSLGFGGGKCARVSAARLELLGALAFLQHLAQAIAGMRLLVVCSSRSEDLLAQRNLPTTLARLERLSVVWRIVLGLFPMRSSTNSSS